MVAAPILPSVSGRAGSEPTKSSRTALDFYVLRKKRSGPPETRQQRENPRNLRFLGGVRGGAPAQPPRARTRTVREEIFLYRRNPAGVRPRSSARGSDAQGIEPAGSRPQREETKRNWGRKSESKRLPTPCRIRQLPATPPLRAAAARTTLRRARRSGIIHSPRHEFDPYQFCIGKIGSRDKLASPLCPTQEAYFGFSIPFPARISMQSGLSRFCSCFHQRSMSLAGALPPHPRKGAALDLPRNLRFLGFSLCLRREGLRPFTPHKGAALMNPVLARMLITPSLSKFFPQNLWTPKRLSFSPFGAYPQFPPPYYYVYSIITTTNNIGRRHRACSSPVPYPP